ncbi:MAG: hypothetical protein ACLRSD_01705 [Oscillibacter sp.]
MSMLNALILAVANKKGADISRDVLRTRAHLGALRHFRQDRR